MPPSIYVVGVVRVLLRLRAAHVAVSIVASFPLDAVITNAEHWGSYYLAYGSVHSQRLDRSAESRRSVFLHVAVEVGIVSGHGDRLRTYNLLLLNVCSNCTGFCSFFSRRSPERKMTQLLLLSIPTQILE